MSYRCRLKPGRPADSKQRVSGAGALAGGQATSGDRHSMGKTHGDSKANILQGHGVETAWDCSRFSCFFVGVWPDSFIHSFIYSMDMTQTDLSKKVSITSIYNQKSAGKFTGSPGAPVLSFRTWSLSISVLCFCFVI